MVLDVLLIATGLVGALAVGLEIAKAVQRCRARRSEGSDHGSVR